MVSRELEKECIVVFDEAHNIDNVCIEVAKPLQASAWCSIKRLCDGKTQSLVGMHNCDMHNCDIHDCDIYNCDIRPYCCMHVCCCITGEHTSKCITFHCTFVLTTSHHLTNRGITAHWMLAFHVCDPSSLLMRSS